MADLLTPLRVFFQATAGQLPAAFDALVFAPSALTLSVAVAESSTPGTYYFDVPSSFWAIEGPGSYYTRVLNGATVVLSQSIEVVDPQPLVQASVTWAGQTGQIVVDVWLQRPGQVDQTIDEARVRLYNAAGAALAPEQSSSVVDANGVIAISFAAPVFAIGETAAYMTVAIMQGTRTYEGVVGLTFARAS